MNSLADRAFEARRRAAQRDGVLGLTGYAAQRLVAERWPAPRKSEESSRVPWRVRQAIRMLPNKSFAIYPGRAVAPERPRYKILFLTHDLSPSGGPRLVAIMASMLLEDGCEVLVASPEDGPMRADLQRAGIGVVVGRRLFENPDVLRSLAEDADVAILNTAVTAPLAADLGPIIPCFIYLHEISSMATTLAGPKGARLRAGLLAASAVWAGSPATAEVARQVRPDVQAVPYGAYPPAIAPAALPQGPEIVVGIFGTYEHRKGQDLALEAMQALAPEHRRKLVVRMYGRVLEPEFHERLRKAVRPDDRVELHKELTHAECMQAMAACDAVLISSRDDTLPQVSLDCLGGRRVLVCTSETGTAEYLREGENGFIAPVADAPSIADALTRLGAARDRLTDIAEAGRRTFQEVFSKETFLARLYGDFDRARR